MTIENGRRSRVLDLSRPGGGVGIEIDASEAAEVLMSIFCLSDTADETDDLGLEARDETYDLGAHRIRELRAIDPDLFEVVSGVAGTRGKVLVHLLGLVYETPKPRTFPAFLERLSAVDPLDLQLQLLGYHARDYHNVSPEAIVAAARGDAAARAALLGACADWPEAREAAESLLDLGGVELKRRLLSFLPRWYEHIFRPLAGEAMDAARRDAAAKLELARSRSAEEMVELATNGVQYTPGPDVRKIVFFPTYVLRPWAVFMDHKDVRIFCYPVGAPAEAGEGPDAAQLARVFKALGDEGRLRLLKRLSEGPLALGEAAELLGVAKSTAHHHLAILRHAGFVLIREDAEKVYTLRPDFPPQAGTVLDAYLHRSRG